MEVTKYSEKASYVIIDIKECVPKFKAYCEKNKISVRFNSSLTDENGNKFAGWIFSTKHDDKVKEFFDAYKKTLTGTEKKFVDPIGECLYLHTPSSTTKLDIVERKGNSTIIVKYNDEDVNAILLRGWWIIPTLSELHMLDHREKNPFIE